MSFSCFLSFLFSSYLTSFGIFAYKSFILIYLLVFDHVALHHFSVVAPVITIYTLSFYSLFSFNILSRKVKHRRLITTNFHLSCPFISQYLMYYIYKYSIVIVAFNIHRYFKVLKSRKIVCFSWHLPFLLFFLDILSSTFLSGIMSL